ncbi:MAG: hypothetical protein QXT68_00320 [Halobacteria archaeon]
MRRALLLLLALSAASGWAEAQAGASVQVVSALVSPDPVPPGATGSVRVTLYNGGTGTATLDQVNLFSTGLEILNFPYRSLGTLAPAQAVNLTLYFRAPKSEGAVQAEVQATAGTSSIRYPLLVKVAGGAQLYIQDAADASGRAFRDIAAGEAGELRLTFAGPTPLLDLRNLEVQVDPLDTSPLDPLGPGKRFLGDVRAPTFTVSFPVQAKAGTKENAYSVPVVVSWSSPASDVPQVANLSLGFRVSGVAQPSLKVEKRAPEPIPAGRPFPVTLNVTNTGQETATALSARLGTSDLISPAGPNTLHRDSLPSGESTEMVFLVSASRGGTGLYTVPVEFKYSSLGGERTQSEVLLLRGAAELSVASVTTDPPQLTAGDGFATLTVRLENVGTADARSVTARLSSLPVEGALSATLGRIKPDEDAPAIFKFRSPSAGVYAYNVTVEYEDDFESRSASFPKQLAVFAPGAPVGPLALLVFLAVLGLLYLRRRRQKRDRL